MKKCRLTVSGKHLWEWGTIKNNDAKHQIYWILEGPRCCLCGLIDDRKIKFPKPVTYTLKNEQTT
jgi:hypothetical protein